MPFSLFTFLFLTSVTIMYYILRKSFRPFVLLAASLFYAFRLSHRACYVLCITTLAVYAFGRLIAHCKMREKEHYAKKLMIIGVALLVSSLLACKTPYLILTIGFSYYVFQAIAYLIDIWRGRIQAESNPAYFALYLCYFPKFISGPIERPETFLPQLTRLREAKLFDLQRLSLSFTELLYGYFLKLVIADRLGIYVRAIFRSYESISWVWLMAGALFYTLQLYADFAGYSALAVGISRLFGIDLTQNFDAPYLALGITEFWRRWHRSLSAWFKEYVYIPLGGNREGIRRKCINTMIVFFLCGLWHGNGLGFIVWGLLHGLYSVIETLFRSKEKVVTPVWQVMGRFLTFIGVSFAWVFFGSASFREALHYILRIITFRTGQESPGAEFFTLGFSRTELLLSVLAVIAACFFDAVIYKSKKSFAQAVAEWKYGWRYLLFYLLIIVIFVFGIYGNGFDTSIFLYMDF